MKKLLIITASLLIANNLMAEDIVVCAQIVPTCILNVDGSVEPQVEAGPCYDQYKETCEAIYDSSCESKDLVKAIDKLKFDYESLNEKYSKLKKRLRGLKRSR